MNNALQSLREFIQQIPVEERKRVAIAISDAQVKLISTIYDKATSYTNVIIVAGYAGFFALWSNARQFPTPFQAKSAAVFMGVSICVFVLFEIYKMTLTGYHLSMKAKILQEQDTLASPIILLDRLDEIDQQMRRYNISFIKAWLIWLFIAIITALAGSAILLGSLARGLF